MNKLRHSLLKRLHWWFGAVAVTDTVWAIFGTWIFLLFTSAYTYSSMARNWPDLLIAAGLVAVLWGAAILNLVAAFRARAMRSHSFLVFVALVNLVPFIHCLYLAGLPAGIIALIALANAPVRGVFVTVASGVPRDAALAQLVQPPRFTAADEMDTANDDWDQAGRSQ